MTIPHAGETIRKKPTCEPWIVITIYTYGWLVADLSSTDDPVISKIILQRDFRNWEREIDLDTISIEEAKRVYNKLDESERKNIWNTL